MNHLAPSGTPKLNVPQFEINGQAITYSVRRSLRARHVRLVVSGKTGLTVVVPVDYELDQLPLLLKRKSRWILKNLIRYGQAHRNGDIRELRSGSRISYLGQQLKIVKSNLDTIPDSIRLDGDRLLINLNNRKIKLNLVVEWWYRQQAEKLIRKKVVELCHLLGLSCGRVTIKGAKTRWGSCSQKGNLNFNWKLMMVPESVIDYVIIHELCHLKEINHSSKFWYWVNKYCPKWHVHRKWLKEHEVKLSANFTL
jgi:predicted metal-dependent hydrolase